MTYFYLLLAMVSSATIAIDGHLYNDKNRERSNVSGLYNLLYTLFSSLGWLVLWISDFSFDLRVLPYALLYGLGESCFAIGMLGALNAGSTSLTALIQQVALVGVSVWGFFFWDTQFTLFSTIGIVLIIVSLSLCLLTKEPDHTSHSTLRWCGFALLITFGNAGCSIVQRYQQTAFDYQHKNMFMFFGVLFASVTCLLLSLREPKENWSAALKTSWVFPCMAGLGCALCNVFVLLLIKYDMSPVIIYPGLAVGGLMITTLISTLFFREKLRFAQWCGLFVGTVALIFLNL